MVRKFTKNYSFWYQIPKFQPDILSLNRAFLRRRDVPEHDYHFDLRRASEKLYKTKIPKEIGDPKNLSNITLCDYDKLKSFFVESYLNDHSIFLSEKFVQY